MSLYPTNLSQMKEHGSLCFTSNGTTIEEKNKPYWWLICNNSNKKKKGKSIDTNNQSVDSPSLDY